MTTNYGKKPSSHLYIKKEKQANFVLFFQILYWGILLSLKFNEPTYNKT